MSVAGQIISQVMSDALDEAEAELRRRYGERGVEPVAVVTLASALIHARVTIGTARLTESIVG